MYALAQKSEHIIWRQQWYAFMSRVSLQVYMIQKDKVFIADVVVIDPMQETMASSAITRPIGATMELNVIIKIHKYKGFREGHHFISMAMDMHDTFEHDMDHFIRDCARFFHDRQLEVIYPYFFTFNFSSSVLILLFSML